MKKVGLLCGREWSFPPKFLDEVNRRNEGVHAEYIKLGGTQMEEPIPYAVVVDRISHEVPYYRSYLKKCLLEGVHVVNNPFMWTADDKFFGATLCHKLNLSHPKTAALPNKDYVPGIVKSESLRNLVYPMDWQAIVDYVGLPCILKDAHGGGWRGVYVCNTMDELIRNYDESGLMTMIAQEFIKWDQYVRCMCLGRKDVLIMPYDTVNRQYIPDENYLTPKLRTRIFDDCLTLVNALGYDMNTVEWAIRDGVPYAIDFMNPAPDMDINSLTPTYFEWCVQGMADMVIDLATKPSTQLSEMKFAKLF
ncbi:MAG: ATP-grasp domain-containing protein [Gemmataceae bacterium]